MVDCTTCGRSLRDVARFCPDCGTPVVQAPAAPAATLSSGAALWAEPTTERTIVAAPASRASEPPAGSVMGPAAGAMSEPSGVSGTRPATTAEADVRCSACGAAVPDGDLFCGDCGAPVAGAAAAGSPWRTHPEPVFQPGAPPVYQAPYAAGRPRAGGSPFADHLSFKSLLVGANAVAVFWVAEGVNLVYWILHWVNYRYGGAEGFLWSAAGFVLFAIVIRILVEAAVSAVRVKDEIAALREDGGRR